MPRSAPTFPTWGRAACIGLVLAAALHAAGAPIPNGDVWVGLACGRYMVGPWAAADPGRTWQMKLLDRAGVHISKRDPFSDRSRPYTGESDGLAALLRGSSSARGVGWINQNWLTHLAFHGLRQRLGENAIVAYVLLQGVAIAFAVYGTARAMGAHPVLAAAASSCAMLVSRSFIDLRPQVASALCAALLLLLLARWKRGDRLATVWVVPVLFFWANAHGGFIYAIVVFAVSAVAAMVQHALARVLPHVFRDVSWSAIGLLVAGLAASVLVPAIASPFGGENLFHPLMVTAGEEGRLWRTVNEWQPLTEGGFGNVAPYLALLGAFALSLTAWLVLLPRRRRDAGLELADLAVLAVTIAMSVVSRRFVFVAGIVVAPFVAVALQGAWESLREGRPVRKVGPPSASALRWLAAGVGTLAAGMVAVFAASVWDVYLGPPGDGRDLTVFERKIAIHRQPVTAARFLVDNSIGGLAWNEWIAGGYLAAAQPPDASSGRPACRVFIDGRAQAAYTPAHYRKWQTLYAERDAPPEWAHRLLAEEGVTAAVLDLRRSPQLFAMLYLSDGWTPVFVGDDSAVLLRRDAPQNAPVLGRLPDQVVYPDEHTRAISRAYLMGRSRDPAQKSRALDLLASLDTDRSAATISQLVFVIGTHLGRTERLRTYFAEQRRIHQEHVDGGRRFARRAHMASLIDALRRLESLARTAGDAEGASRHEREAAHYLAMSRREATRWLW